MIYELQSKQLDGTARCRTMTATNPLLNQRNPRKGVADNEVKGFDYVKLFNTLVDSLFAGEAPYRLQSLEDVPRVSSEYEELLPAAREFGDVDSYYRITQAANFFKKLQLEIPEWIRTQETNAKQKWLQSESLCKETNRLLWNLKKSPLSLASSDLGHVVSKVRDEVAIIMGDHVPEFSEVACFAEFGPGVSLSTKRDELDPIMKCINPSALSSQKDEVWWLLLHSCMGPVLYGSLYGNGVPHQRGKLTRYEAELVMKQVLWIDHEKYATVPKSISQRRSIGVGGSLATWIQQAYDGFVRGRLKLIGVDLRDQRPNQRLARLGSLNEGDNPCTIDLTEASNRISFGLIPMLFNVTWARLLVANRAKFTLVGKDRILNEKFSAMGNALTFSLQSVIFSAVVRSILKERRQEGMRWRVYGDDIIVPKLIYNQVVEWLVLLGFEPNRAKSFSEGNFRESCGADYLSGINVRPLYVKEPIRTVADLYKYINLCLLQAANAPIPAHQYRSTIKVLLDAVPKHLRAFGEPTNVLDSYIWDSAISGLPRYLLTRSVLADNIPDCWGYYRSLLVKRNADSHWRLRKKSLVVSGKRQSPRLDAAEWILVRSPRFYRPLEKGDCLMSTFFIVP